MQPIFCKNKYFPKLTTFIHISQLFTDKNTNFANTILNEYEYGE